MSYCEGFADSDLSTLRRYADGAEFPTPTCGYGEEEGNLPRFASDFRDVCPKRY